MIKKPSMDQPGDDPAAHGTVTEQLLDEWPVKALQATLGSAASPVALPELPLLWHWLYFLPTVPREQLGVDGHPRRADAGDSPPRRMFAAVRTRVDIPLRVGERAQESVAVVGERDTVGNSGALRIVTYEHRYSQQGKLCIVEQRDIVYVSAAPAVVTAGAAVRPEARWRRQVVPDAAMLMRFSAITFNSHRIHYDQQYAQQVEGHRERVVHAPLTSLLLVELARSNVSRRLHRYECRARSPLYIDEPIELLATPGTGEVALSAIGRSGVVAMQASAWF